MLLDGSASSDPDPGDLLTFAWTDASGAQLATEATVTISPAVGTHTYTLSVSDGEAPTASDDVVVTVADTLPPEISGVPTTLDVSAAGACAATIPDLRVGAVVFDQCAATETLTITQTPAPGTELAAGGAVEVTVTATDPAGRTASVVASVTLTEVGAGCGAPDGEPEAEADAGADVGADSEAGSDSEADSEADSDSDSDSDSDAGPDAPLFDATLPDLGGSQGKHRSGCDCDAGGGGSALPPFQALLFALVWFAMLLGTRRRALGRARR